jgi:CRISPR-associated endoribonuclease Cas6
MSARIHLQLVASGRLIPFAYRHVFAGRVHAWIGSHNPFHDARSLYSLGPLQGGRGTPAGIHTTKGEALSWHIGSWEAPLLIQLLEGITESPELAFGLRVVEARLALAPVFSSHVRFRPDSPILLRSRRPDQTVAHITYQDAQADDLLTKSLQNKLRHAGLTDTAAQTTARFVRETGEGRTKLIPIKNIQNRASLCPIEIEGPPEASRMAWVAGIGNGTGVGFGSLQVSKR